jgi:hypothetical protein
MLRDGIKAAQIQAHSSALNSSWAAGPFHSLNVVSAIKRAAARMNARVGGRKYSEFV